MSRVWILLLFCAMCQSASEMRDMNGHTYLECLSRWKYGWPPPFPECYVQGSQGDVSYEWPYILGLRFTQGMWLVVSHFIAP